LLGLFFHGINFGIWKDVRQYLDTLQAIVKVHDLDISTLGIQIRRCVGQVAEEKIAFQNGTSMGCYCGNIPNLKFAFDPPRFGSRTNQSLGMGTYSRKHMSRIADGRHLKALGRGLSYGDRIAYCCIEFAQFLSVLAQT